MYRLAREIYSIIEAVFSKTGSFGPPRPVKDGSAASTASTIIRARHAKTQIFIGAMAQDAFEIRLAAD